MTPEPRFDFAAHVSRFTQVSHYADDTGYIVWRRGSGDNVELLHIRAYKKKIGVGKRLLFHMVRELQKDPPYKTVFGFTRTGNDAAKGFYTALGFTLSEVNGVYADGTAVLFSQSYELLISRLSREQEPYYSEAGKLMAVVARHNDNHSGIVFFTDPENILQVGKVQYPVQGSVIRHVHNPVPRHIEGTAEMLFVLKGKMRITLGSATDWQINHVILTTGDVIILSPDCVHSIFMLEPTVLLECKNGPYLGREVDKTFLEDAPGGSVPTS